MNVTGIVIKIESYSMHNGPGIGPVLFLKGCPMTTVCCSNPKSQNHQPDV